MADYIVLGLIAMVFIGAGIVVPLINAEYGLEDVQDYDSPLATEEQPTGIVSLGTYLLSIGSMFFWSFGAIPIWLDAVFLVMRFIFWAMVVELLWI